MAHTPGPLRKSPSGPLANLPAPPAPVPSGQFPFYHVENISFGTFIFSDVEGQSTKEITKSIGPLPPLDDPGSVWDVIANPSPIEGNPAWFQDFSLSHVRIQLFRPVPGNDPSNLWIPPAGCFVADVVLGLSSLKDTGAEQTTSVLVDLMFFRRGIALNELVPGGGGG